MHQRLADAGVENRNGAVDALIESGLLRRVLAMTENCLSNSLIEVYFGTGADVAGRLEAAKQAARRERLEANRAARCAVCS